MSASVWSRASLGPLVLAGLVTAAAIVLLRPEASNSREGAGRVVRCPATRDVWLSAVDGETEFNMGAAPRLKLKQWQELALVDFDVSTLAGRVIEQAFLYLLPAGGHRLGLNGGSDLRWLTVSTVSHDWVEGLSRRYARDEKGRGATFLESSYGRRGWGWEGARLWNVILGNGNSLRFDGRLEPISTAGGDPSWLRIEIDPRLVEALVAGASHGLALLDGSSDVNVNSFVASRESGDGPFLEVRLGGEDRAPPQAPGEARLAAAPAWATAEHGAAEIRLRVPAEAFSFDLRIDGRQVERWQVPFAAEAGEIQAFPIQDLPPDRQLRAELTAVDAAGNRSRPVNVQGRASSRLTVPALPPAPFRPLGGDPPTLGSAKVWAFPEVTKVDPVTGLVLGEAGAADLRRENGVWEGATRTVRLAAARGEIVGFQLAVEGRAAGCRIRLSPLTGTSQALEPGVRLWRNWYVGRQPEYAIPLTDAFEVPAGDNAVPGQAVQAVTVDLHVPPETPAGTYRGKVEVSSTDGRVELPLLVEVYDVVLPDEIHFNVELNTYRGPGRAGSRRFVDSFRLAHYHRATLNRVPYSQRGAVHADWTPEIDASGRVVDWRRFDENLGGLLDGSWFTENPRRGVPVPTLYLPLFEGWPLDFRVHYHPGDGVPINATDPDRKLRHDTLAKPIDEAFDEAFKNAFVGTTRDFAEHFEARGWNRTRFQLYLNNKPRYGHTLWTLDEPFEYLDWAALNFFGGLFRQAVDDPETYSTAWQDQVYRRGLAAMRRERAMLLFRADVSRPMWQGSVSDGLINDLYVGSGALEYPRLLRELKLRMPALLSVYGSANEVGESNWLSVLWCLQAFARHADGVLPWQSVGGPEALRRPTRTALLIDGGPYGHAVASLRLHALRRGAQDSELLRLLQLQRGWSREHLGLLLSAVERSGKDTASGGELFALKEGLLQLLTASPGSGR